jgi:hypothetical protein
MLSIDYFKVSYIVTRSVNSLTRFDFTEITK